MKTYEPLVIDNIVYENNNDAPHRAAIYFVYQTWVDEKTKKSMWIPKPYYIGETNDMHRRIEDHLGEAGFRDDLSDVAKKNSTAVMKYTYAFFTGAEVDRKRIEAALIYKYKPVHNKDHKYDFGRESTSVDLQGNVTGFGLEAKNQVDKDGSVIV